MSEAKRFAVDIVRENDGCVSVSCDSAFLVQVWGAGRDDSEAIADLALKSLRAQIVGVLERMKV